MHEASQTAHCNEVHHEVDDEQTYQDAVDNSRLVIEDVRPRSQAVKHQGSEKDSRR